jgi:nitric oxide reductase subunit B
LLFLGLILGTLYKGKRRTTTALVLTMGLVFAALLYLPGMIWFDSQVTDSFFRWWVVHLWVEGVWELIMGGILSYLLIKLTGVDREVIEKWLYVIVGLTFLSGILGTGHHYYFIGVNKIWLVVGGIFSALEPLAFLGMALFAVYMYRKGEKNHPNKIALFWTIGASIVSFIGAGVLGFAHTLPQTNVYTHGTLVTASHGHLAFWGAYAMIVLAIISYALPNLTGRKRYTSKLGHLAFWFSNVGMLGMTAAFGVAGIIQVYLERKQKLDFMQVQNEISIHFVVLILCASLFTIGILMYIYEFIKYGKASDEGLVKAEDQE